MKNLKKIIFAVIVLSQTFMLVSYEKEPIEMVQIPNQLYKMSKTEITQKFYESIMGENPSTFKGENKPVNAVSWNDAIYFCNKLSVKCGYTPVYSVNGVADVTKWNYTPHQKEKIEGKITQNRGVDGFRLPTYAEWGYAAKGGQYYEYAGSYDIDEVAWYGNNSMETTHTVARKKANGYGIYDMTGNVWEWCWDFNKWEDRSIRGGSWINPADLCTISNRTMFGEAENIRRTDIGFRVVRTVMD